MVAPEAVEDSEGVDQALRWLVTLISSALHPPAENSRVCKVKDEKRGDWPEVTKSQLERGKLPVMPREVPLRDKEAWGV